MPRDKENVPLSRKERFYPERRPGGFESISPFNVLRRFSDEMDRMFGDYLPIDFGRAGQGVSRTGGSGDWMPAIEVFERDNKIIVRADLPGINPEDVKVELQDDGLIIQGETKHEEEEKREGFYHTERSYGRFSRFIPLPENINADQITANFQNGLLEVSVPVPEQTKNKKQIQIQTEAKGKTVDVGTNKEKDTEKKSAKV